MPDTLCRRGNLDTDASTCVVHGGTFGRTCDAHSGGPDFTPKEWPTMPDTLTPEELAAIRERDWLTEHHQAYELGWSHSERDRRALLRHIDALTAAASEMVQSYVDAEAGNEFNARTDAAYKNLRARLRGEQ